MDVSIDGCIDGFALMYMDGWMIGWMDVRMYGCMDGRTNIWMEGWMDGSGDNMSDRWMDACG